MQQEALKGIKVVELATVLAGPAVGMFFAELGAQVLKIENKLSGGDPTRGWKSKTESFENPASAYYYSVNWNKQIEFLDFTEYLDRKTLHAFLEVADVLIVNFKSGDAQKFDLESSVLRLRYPSLIIAEVLGFDESDRVAYDAVLQAEAGFMSINGEVGGDSLKLPLAFIDVLCAHQLKEGILLAMLQREKTGQGAVVSASLYQSALASLINQSSIYLNTGVIPSRMGSLHPNIAPYGETFECKDTQKILLAVGTEKQFQKLCMYLNREDIFRDDRFGSNTSRVKNRKELYLILETEFAKLESVAILAALHQQKIPAAALRNLKQVLDEPAAQEMVLEQVEPDGTISKRMSTIAFKIDSI